MKRLVKKVCILFFIINLDCYCQTVNYRFVFYDSDSISGNIMHQIFEKDYKRKYFSKNKFKETLPILNNKFTYKIIDGKWYFKQDGRWELFFDNGNKVNSYINYDNYKEKLLPGEMEHIKIIWKKSDLLDSLSNQIVYKLCLKIGVHWDCFYFTYKDGIIGKDTDFGYLIRNDKRYLKLRLANWEDFPTSSRANPF